MRAIQLQQIQRENPSSPRRFHSIRPFPRNKETQKEIRKKGRSKNQQGNGVKSEREKEREAAKKKKMKKERNFELDKQRNFCCEEDGWRRPLLRAQCRTHQRHYRLVTRLKWVQ